VEHVNRTSAQKSLLALAAKTLGFYFTANVAQQAITTAALAIMTAKVSRARVRRTSVLWNRVWFTHRRAPRGSSHVTAQQPYICMQWVEFRFFSYANEPLSALAGALLGPSGLSGPCL
jgi:hypothetical protein